MRPLHEELPLRRNFEKVNQTEKERMPIGIRFLFSTEKKYRSTVRTFFNFTLP
jgi:hypothetical protein